MKLGLIMTDMTTLMTLLVFFGTLAIVTCAVPSSNPECTGMKTFSDSLKSMMKVSMFKTTVNCNPLKNCSGVTCAGTAVGNYMNMTLVLEQCTQPIRIKMHLRVPKQNIDEWRVFESGKKMEILKDLPIGILFKVSASVTPTITRQGDNVSISGSACFDFGIQKKCPPLPVTYIMASRNSCSSSHGASTSPTAAKPSTTSSIRTSSASSAAKSVTTTPQNPLTSKKATSTKVIPKSSGTSSKTNPTTPNDSTAKQPKTNGSSKKATPSALPHSKKRPSHAPLKQHHDNGLSTGSKVAIVASVILVVFLVLGLVVYWQRLKRRRPAYYNDILTNRDTSMGFDDDEPLFDSHLVL